MFDPQNLQADPLDPYDKKDEVLDILAVLDWRIIPATRRSWSFFEPMLTIYIAKINYENKLQTFYVFEYIYAQS